MLINRIIVILFIFHKLLNLYIRYFAYTHNVKLYSYRNNIFNFEYESYALNEEVKIESELPTPRDPDQELIIHFREKHSNVRVDVRFLVFDVNVSKKILISHGRDDEGFKKYLQNF